MAEAGQIAGSTVISSTGFQILWSSTSGIFPAGSTSGVMTFNINASSSNATNLLVNVAPLVPTTSSWETLRPGREGYFRVGSQGINKIMVQGSTTDAAVDWGPRATIPGA